MVTLMPATPAIPAVSAMAPVPVVVMVPPVMAPAVIRMVPPRPVPVPVAAGSDADPGQAAHGTAHHGAFTAAQLGPEVAPHGAADRAPEHGTLAEPLRRSGGRRHQDQYQQSAQQQFPVHGRPLRFR